MFYFPERQQSFPYQEFLLNLSRLFYVVSCLRCQYMYSVNVYCTNVAHHRRKRRFSWPLITLYSKALLLARDHASLLEMCETGTGEVMDSHPTVNTYAAEFHKACGILPSLVLFTCSYVNLQDNDTVNTEQ